MHAATEYYKVYYPDHDSVEERKFDSLAKAVACAERKQRAALVYECQVDATGQSSFDFFVLEVPLCLE